MLLIRPNRRAVLNTKALAYIWAVGMNDFCFYSRTLWTARGRNSGFTFRLLLFWFIDSCFFQTSKEMKDLKKATAHSVLVYVHQDTFLHLIFLNLQSLLKLVKRLTHFQWISAAFYPITTDSLYRSAWKCISIWIYL